MIAKDRVFTLATNFNGAICHGNHLRNESKWYCCGNGQSVTIGTFDVANTLDCMHDQKFIVGERTMNWDGKETFGTLTVNNAVKSQRMPDKGNMNAVIQKKPPRKYVLRRLTPLECCRLQGFPDWWTDGIEGSDSNQYKMWGNGIALPCAADVIGRIVKAVRERKDEKQ